MNNKLKCFNCPHHSDLSDRTDNYEGKNENFFVCKNFLCSNRYTYCSEEEEYDDNDNLVRLDPKQESLPKPTPKNTGQFSVLASRQKTCAATLQTPWTLITPAVSELGERLLAFTTLTNLRQLPTGVLDPEPTIAVTLQLADILAMINGLMTQIGNLTGLVTTLTMEVTNLTQQVSMLITV